METPITVLTVGAALFWIILKLYRTLTGNTAGCTGCTGCPVKDEQDSCSELISR